MSGGFQNKYYFFKETDHSGEKISQGAPGYISFWESNGTLKINVLIENITKEIKKLELFLCGGNKKIKIAELSPNKKCKNGTFKSAINFKTKLPDGLTLNDFDTAYINNPSDNTDNPILETHSQHPCKESKEEQENQRTTPTSNLISPEEAFSGFKQFDPFNTTNHAYKWWICESYNRICDTLHKMDIHLPGFAAKSLYANMQFFKHAILGKYTSVEDRIFVIVGIPVQNLPQLNSPQSPARPMMCQRFINNTGYKGYLLFYIDYASTALVKAVVV